MVFGTLHEDNGCRHSWDSLRRAGATSASRLTARRPCLALKQKRDPARADGRAHAGGHLDRARRAVVKQAEFPFQSALAMR